MKQSNSKTLLHSEANSNIKSVSLGDNKKLSPQENTSNIKASKINVGLTTKHKPRKRRPNLFYDTFVALYKYDPSTNNDEFYAIIEDEDDIKTYLGVSKRTFSSSLCHILSGRSKLMISKNGDRVVPYVYSKLDDEE